MRMQTWIEAFDSARGSRQRDTIPIHRKKPETDICGAQWMRLAETQHMGAASRGGRKWLGATNREREARDTRKHCQTKESETAMKKRGIGCREKGWNVHDQYRRDLSSVCQFAHASTTHRTRATLPISTFSSTRRGVTTFTS